MNRIFTLFLSLSVLLISTSSTPLGGEESLDDVFKRIKEEVENNSKAYTSLGDACAKIGHRLTGSPQGKKAEEYVYKMFKDYGFRDVKYQGFQVEAWARDTVTLSVAPPKSDDFREIQVVSLAMTPVEANIQGAIVDVGNGLDADFESKKEWVKGKVVLANIGLLDAAPGTTIWCHWCYLFKQR
jgi:carboxypeptidase Q